VVCAYHGWEFNGDGNCTKMPSMPFCRNVGVAALPCAEKDGFIWVWPGDGLPAEVRAVPRQRPAALLHAARGCADRRVPSGLLQCLARSVRAAPHCLRPEL
jgi:chlorophyllide a oxygenase